MMSVWRKFAFGLLICSPAALGPPGFAGMSQASDAQRLILAQAAPAQGGGTPADAGAAGTAEAEGATDPATAEAGAGEEAQAVAFTEEFLDDPAHQAVGKELWDGTCQACHGSKAYPGKAPKLRPSKYTPEFVYDRVTNGFRKMPAWKDILTDEERMNVVSYVLSRKFSP